jgi:hypothetical protein
MQEFLMKAMNFLYVVGGVAVGAMVSLGMNGFFDRRRPQQNVLPSSPPAPKMLAAPKTKWMVSIFDKATGDVLMANVEVVAEESDGKGHYRFFRPDGLFYNLNLSDGSWIIQRQQVPLKNSLSA